MPPTLDQIVEQVDRISVRMPKSIFSDVYMAREVSRRLKSSVPFVNKMLGKLAEEGRIKRLWVSPGGALYLEREEKLAGGSPPYLHCADYTIDHGTVKVEYNGSGNLWAGSKAHPYMLSASAWEAMYADLRQQSEQKVAAEKEERVQERAKEEAELERAVPGYAAVREALGALIPGASVECTLIGPEENPRVYGDVKRLGLDHFKVIVDLLRKGLEAKD